MLRPTVLFMFGLLTLGGMAQVVDLAVHGFRSDVTVPISDLTKRSLEYAHLHHSQASGMNFAGRVLNQGPDTAFNVIVEMHAERIGEDLGTFSSDTLLFLAPGAADTLPISAELEVSSWPPVISLEFNVNSESVDTTLSNDLDSISMRIEEYRFMRAERWSSDTVGTSEYASTTYVRYEIAEPELACGVVCIIPYNPELVGFPIIGFLYDEEFNVLTEAEVALSQSGMSEPGEANWITINFTEYVELEPGHDYYAAVWTYGQFPISFAAGGQCPDSSAFRYDEIPDFWTALDRTPLIGLNLGGDCFGGVGEQLVTDVELRPCVPDPASTTTTLFYSLPTASTVRLDIRSAAGVLKDTQALGRQGPGEHTLDLDVSALPAGVYSCSVIIDNARATRRLVVVH